MPSVWQARVGNFQAFRAGIISALLFLAACSTIPPLDPFNRVPVDSVTHHIQCEIRSALADNPKLENYMTTKNWGMTYDLNLSVDAKGSLAPSVSVMRPYHPGSKILETFTLGAGLNYSGTASRKETFRVKQSISALMREDRIYSDCNKRYANGQDNGGRDLNGNLGIKDWLDTITPLLPTPTGRGEFRLASKSQRSTSSQPEFNSIGHTVKFVLIGGANVAPTISTEKLKAGSGNLIDLSRTDTNELILTFAVDHPAAEASLTKQYYQLLVPPAQ